MKDNEEGGLLNVVLLVDSALLRFSNRRLEEPQARLASRSL